MRQSHINHQYIKDLCGDYPVLEPLSGDIQAAAELLIRAAERGGQILICGNGGSAADADHIVGELMKSFVRPRPLAPEIRQKLAKADNAYGNRLASSLQSGIRALSLTGHTALSTAFSNDEDPALVFAQQTIVLGREHDVFWGLSTSGNSENVLLAAAAAGAKGMSVLGMTGAGGGKLAALCDVNIAVPETETYKVQELHLPVYHRLCLILEDYFFG